MVDIKAHIYSLLINDPAISFFVGDNIHYYSEAFYENRDYYRRIPQLTISRITSNTTDICGIRTELMQISSWAISPMQAEQLSNEVVRLFNRTSDNIYKHCAFTGAMDMFGADTKVFGIHATFRFTIYDPMY